LPIPPCRKGFADEYDNEHLRAEINSDDDNAAPTRFGCFAAGEEADVLN
jgi:hypothetical protein